MQGRHLAGRASLRDLGGSRTRYVPGGHRGFDFSYIAAGNAVRQSGRTRLIPLRRALRRSVTSSRKLGGAGSRHAEAPHIAEMTIRTLRRGVCASANLADLRRQPPVASVASALVSCSRVTLVHQSCERRQRRGGGTACLAARAGLRRCLSRHRCRAWPRSRRTLAGGAEGGNQPLRDAGRAAPRKD